MLDIQCPTLELIKRLDARGKTERSQPYDQEAATIVHRLEQHERVCLPVVQYYGKQPTVTVIDGDGSPDEVWERIQPAAEKAWAQGQVRGRHGAGLAAGAENPSHNCFI